MLKLLRKISRSSVRMKRIAQSMQESQTIRVLLSPFIALDKLLVVSHQFSARTTLRKLSVHDRFDVLVIEPREFHSEVVAAVVSQLKHQGHNPFVFTTPENLLRLAPFDSYACKNPYTLRAILREAINRRFPVICTTDYYGFPPFILSTNSLRRINGLLLVHNYDRYAKQHSYLANIMPVMPSLQIDMEVARFVLVEQPRTSSYGSEEWSTGKQKLRIGVVGRSRMTSADVKEIANYGDGRDDIEFRLIGQYSEEIERIIRQSRSLSGVDATRIRTDVGLIQEVRKLDFLLLTKDHLHYERNWSGMAQHSLSNGVPIIAPRTVLKSWGFPSEISVGYCGSFANGVTKAMELNEQERKQLVANLDQFAREAFETSSILLSTLVKIDNSINRSIF